MARRIHLHRSVGLPVLFLLLLLFSFAPADAIAQTPFFVDASEEAGIAKRHRNSQGWARMAIGTGAAWIDYDQDGHLDLFLSHGLGKNDLFHNLGDGTFEELADSLGVADWDNKGAGVAVADYNNDGWPDIYLANADEDVLLKNINGQRFEDVTVAVGLDTLPEARGMSAAWGDYNNDGFVDLYITHHSNFDRPEGEKYDRLLLNQAGVSFVDVSDLLDPVARNGFGFIGAWTDFDNDNDLDIFLVNDCGFLLDGVTFTRVFRNDGGNDPLSWKFTEVAAEVGADHCHSGMGIAIGDYNRDGWTDYFYTNIGEETLLLQNEGGTFANVTAEAGVKAIDPDGIELWTWGANFIDYDLDGWLDLFVDAGSLYLFTQSDVDPQANLFFVNQGDGTFTNESAPSGLNTTKRSRTSILGDYDNDGDPDLFVVNSNEEIYLYKNNQESQHNWLIVELEGSLSNRSGIGAKIKLTDTAGAHQYWEVRSGSSLGGGDDLAAYFGLGTELAASLEITWPSGTVQQIEAITSNQRLQVIEPGNGVAVEEPDRIDQDLVLVAYPNPFRNATNIVTSGTGIINTNASQLDVFDVRGRKVFTTTLPTGSPHVVWNGADQYGRDLPSGVYLIRLQTAQSSISHVVTKQ